MCLGSDIYPTALFGPLSVTPELSASAVLSELLEFGFPQQRASRAELPVSHCREVPVKLKELEGSDEISPELMEPWEPAVAGYEMSLLC